MKTEKQFRKGDFAKLLEYAKGDRSINQYALDTGISAAHISRLLREMIDSPPTPDTISKFAKFASSDVSYRDFMIAAGYITEESPEDLDSPRNRMIMMEELEHKFFQIILAYLYDQDFYWSIKKPEGRRVFPDMTIDIDHDGYKRWFLEFRGTLNKDRRFVSTMPVYHLYGRLAVEELLPTDKFTIAVNDQRLYEQILNRPPLSLRANLYVMLVDLDAREIIKEEKVTDFKGPCQ